MNNFKKGETIHGSFRDPSGFLFYQSGSLFRQVNHDCKEDYDQLMGSGLYADLLADELLISHEEVDASHAQSVDYYKILKPEIIPTISYPYEWCFSQLKDAALTTLKIQRRALAHDMSLKDASAYNIQFRNNKPIFIDTLSFEKYTEGYPWVAYRQFCQHFLAPLALMSYKDVRLNQLLRIYIDGIPLDLASSLLPFKTRFKFNLLSHIHLHAKSQEHFADKQVTVKRWNIGLSSFICIIDNLEETIKNLLWQPHKTEWGDYIDDTNYSSAAFNCKKQIVTSFLEMIEPKNVWDLGANVGVFSRIASRQRIPTIAFDIDPAAVEKNYLECVRNNEADLLPLLLDLTNPSPSIGWQNQERMSWLERGPADTVLALALIHHLAISNNIPFENITSFFEKLCNSLIIEFVPKSDSQVQRLLATRKDIFPNYTKKHFEYHLSKCFIIQYAEKIKCSERTIYLMKKRNIAD